MVNVTWNDAVAFCEWLSKKEGKKYQLPTEAEWEYTCRAGTKTRFYSGEGEETLKGVANITGCVFEAEMPEEASWVVAWDDGYPFTAPVGKFKPNAFGLYDMHGNVWEWCADWYGDYPQGKVVDPQGPEDGERRVLRGGSFSLQPSFVRSAHRFRFVPTDRRPQCRLPCGEGFYALTVFCFTAHHSSRQQAQPLTHVRVNLEYHEALHCVVGWDGNTVNVTQVRAGNIGAFDNADNSLFRGAIHDGQGQAVALDKQFQSLVKLVIGLERSDIGAHQVRSDDQAAQRRRLRSQMNFFQAHHSEIPALFIGHGQAVVSGLAQTLDDFGEPISWSQGGHILLLG